MQKVRGSSPRRSTKPRTDAAGPPGPAVEIRAASKLTGRAVVSQRVKPGMCMMYHAQEKIVNTPGSEMNNVRGGIHNSVTRTVVKPTHMIGGYAQLSYGFNYYGTIGTNRDEFVLLRKMSRIDWLDTPVANQLIQPTLHQGEVA